MFSFNSAEAASFPVCTCNCVLSVVYPKQLRFLTFFLCFQTFCFLAMFCFAYMLSDMLHCVEGVLFNKMWVLHLRTPCLFLAFQLNDHCYS